MPCGIDRRAIVLSQFIPNMRYSPIDNRNHITDQNLLSAQPCEKGIFSPSCLKLPGRTEGPEDGQFLDDDRPVLGWPPRKVLRQITRLVRSVLFCCRERYTCGRCSLLCAIPDCLLPEGDLVAEAVASQIVSGVLSPGLSCAREWRFHHYPYVQPS